MLTVVALHLCFLPWALGTMHVWSQVTSLVLSALGFVLSLIPRIYSGDYALPMSGQLPAPSSQLRAHSSQLSRPNNPQPITFNRGTAYRLSAWPRLLRFPIFWLGLALLAYIGLQASNPSWVWERNATTWWLRRVNDIPWLPTSVDTPFEKFDVWRQFIIYASAWLTVCTVWTGFTRRRSLQLLLFVLASNATLLALDGFIQPLITPYRILGILNWHPETTPYASFIYKNHAGAYFALLAFVPGALAMWLYDHGERTFKKSTPTGLLAIAGFFVGGSVLFTNSRGASAILTIACLLLTGWFFLRRRLRPDNNPMSPATMAITVVFAATLLSVASYVNLTGIYVRIDRLMKEQSADESSRMRLQAYAAGMTMLGDNWDRGIGSGGFRYLFPEYIKKYPTVYAGGYLYWEHAHRDWIEIPIELGLAGSLLLVAGAMWGLRFFVRHRVVWHSLAVPILLGCSQTLVHAWFDFPFQCPAILITWLALVAITARWVELDGNA